MKMNRVFATLVALMIFAATTVTIAGGLAAARHQTLSSLARAERPTPVAEVDDFNKANYAWKWETVRGMQYWVLYKYSQSSAGAIYVVNVTKDELEVEKLRAELRALKGE